MRILTGVLLACMLSIAGFAQEPAPSNALPQPVASQGTVNQPVLNQGAAVSQPIVSQRGVTQTPPAQTATSQPIPASLSIPLYTMPTQPQVSLPLAKACGCGVSH